MRELLLWLREVEQLASDLYAQEARLFEARKDFSAFLRRLSEDERTHRDLMDTLARALASTEEAPEPAIKLNEGLKRRLAEPFRKAKELASAGRLSERQAIALIVEAEFSEWNDVFLYAVNSLKEYTTSAGHLAATLQAHEDRIKAFVNSLPGDLKPGKNTRELPPVWNARVLVVDDDVNLLEALESFLSRRVRVETARDGREGLAKAQAKFFDLVLTDVRMPVMDGFEFYARLAAVEPEMKGRFLFWSGALTDEQLAYLAERGLPHVQKPLDLAVLLEQVMQTVRKLSRDM